MEKRGSIGGCWWRKEEGRWVAEHGSKMMVEGADFVGWFWTILGWCLGLFSAKRGPFWLLLLSKKMGGVWAAFWSWFSGGFEVREERKEVVFWWVLGLPWVFGREEGRGRREEEEEGTPVEGERRRGEGTGVGMVVGRLVVVSGEILLEIREE